MEKSMKHPKSTWAIKPAMFSLASVLSLCGWSQESKVGIHNDPDACFNVEGSNLASQYREIRTIEDLGTHTHWMLLRDLSRPAAPAVLIQGQPDSKCVRLRIEKSGLRSAPNLRRTSLPVVHAGDYLIVSEHTRSLDAELEATALKPAAIGESLTVRLKFGGHILSAIATAPGRASLSQESSEVRR
jgi:hypothetical protein